MYETLNETRLVYLFESIQRGTMRAAADALNIAPSAVSRQVALLEEELGITLIERHTRGIKPTEAGKLLSQYYREQHSHKADVLAELQELRGLRKGTIRIVLGEGFVSDMMAGPLAKFGADYKDISVVLDVGGTSEIMRRVSEDEADMGLVMNPPPDNKIVSRKYSRQPIYAVVGPDFPLLHKPGPFEIKDFLPYPMALNHTTFGLRQILQLVEQTEKIRLTPNLTTNSFYILRQFVRLQMGVTFLPSFVVSSELASGELFTIPVKHPVMENAEAHLITRSGRKLSSAANKMLQYMSSRLTSMQ